MLTMLGRSHKHHMRLTKPRAPWSAAAHRARRGNHLERLELGDGLGDASVLLLQAQQGGAGGEEQLVYEAGE